MAKEAVVPVATCSGSPRGWRPFAPFFLLAYWYYREVLPLEDGNQGGSNFIALRGASKK
jgi:hypothetical protein